MTQTMHGGLPWSLSSLQLQLFVVVAFGCLMSPIRVLGESDPKANDNKLYIVECHPKPNELESRTLYVIEMMINSSIDLKLVVKPNDTCDFLNNKTGTAMYTLAGDNSSLQLLLYGIDGVTTEKLNAITCKYQLTFSISITGKAAVKEVNITSINVCPGNICIAHDSVKRCGETGECSPAQNSSPRIQKQLNNGTWKDMSIVRPGCQTSVPLVDAVFARNGSTDLFVDSRDKARYRVHRGTPDVTATDSLSAEEGPVVALSAVVAVLLVVIFVLVVVVLCLYLRRNGTRPVSCLANRHPLPDESAAALRGTSRGVPGVEEGRHDVGQAKPCEMDKLTDSSSSFKTVPSDTES